MREADTSLDDALRRLAAFHSRYGNGVVAQLVEHHNGIVPEGVSDPRRASSNALQHLSGLPVFPARILPVPSIAAAVADLLRAKEASRRRQVYVRSLKQYLGQFSRGRESLPVSSLTVADLESWFAARVESASSRASNIGRLSALFSYSKRRGWISENPCDRLERIAIDPGTPRIFNASQSLAVLSVCTPSIRPWVALGLFAGLRPTEAERLDWRAVRLTGSEPCVVVDAAASKVRRRRIVPLCDTAVSWLALDVRETGPIVSSHSTLRRARRDAAARAGVEWTQDVARHTYASMRIGRGDAAERVAADMGNSARILLTHYRELVTREDAAAFWSLRPTPFPFPQ